jgi:hypothetical protein
MTTLLRPECETWFRKRSEPSGEVPQWLRNAEERVVIHAHRFVTETTKRRARDYLNPAKRWQLDMLFEGLGDMDTEEALVRIEWCRKLPSYQNRVSLLNLRGAELAFRWLRMVEREAEAMDCGGEP